LEIGFMEISAFEVGLDELWLGSRILLSPLIPNFCTSLEKVEIR
jgi:hypothetical protein